LVGFGGEVQGGRAGRVQGEGERRAWQGISLIQRGSVQGEGWWGPGRVFLPEDLLTRAGSWRLLLYVEVLAEPLG
jgi:hypothetical protein